MSKHNCQNCLFGDMCPAAQVCEHFAPLDDDGVEEYIESERQGFYSDWFRYATETGD